MQQDKIRLAGEHAETHLNSEDIARLPLVPKHD
jgi:hypothetical protein